MDSFEVPTFDLQNFDLVDSLSFFPMFLLDAFVYRFCHCPIFIRVQNSIVSRIVILWNALELFWALYFHIFYCTYMCWSIIWLDVLKYISHNSCLINTQYPPCDHSSFKISYFSANKLWYLLQLKIAAMRNMSSFICLTLCITKQRLN